MRATTATATATTTRPESTHTRKRVPVSTATRQGPAELGELKRELAGGVDMQTDSAQGAWESAALASVNFVAWLASCGIRTHDLPRTERVLCQLS